MGAAQRLDAGLAFQRMLWVLVGFYVRVVLLLKGRKRG